MHIVVGLDCGRGNVTACPISGPVPDLKEFARSYAALVFYSNRADLERLLELGSIFAIEPTGSDHRIFVNWLRRNGKTVHLCKGDRIRNHARSRGLTNKKDREDAAAIADFTIRALAEPAHFPNAFIVLECDDIRGCRNRLRSLGRAQSPLINQLWATLAEEFPEIGFTASGRSRKFSVRAWGEPEPPKLLRWLAGEISYPSYDARLAATVGRGLSEYSRALARMLCEIERQAVAVEAIADPLLAQIPPWYHLAFDKWCLSKYFRLEFLSATFPFEKFLDDEGNPIHVMVPAVLDTAKNELTFRDRSLKKFCLQMGMGKVVSESGKSKGEWVMGGSKATRIALYLMMETCVLFAMGRTKPRRLKGEDKAAHAKRLEAEGWLNFRDWVTERAEELHQPKIKPWENAALIAEVAERNKVKPAIADLQIYKMLSPTMANQQKNKAVMKLASRFTRQLYRELLRQYKAAKNDQH
jgi:transposase